MRIGKNKQLDQININNTEYTLVKSMKALGVYFEGNLCWDTQAETALKRGKN